MSYNLRTYLLYHELGFMEWTIIAYSHSTSFWLNVPRALLNMIQFFTVRPNRKGHVNHKESGSRLCVFVKMRTSTMGFVLKTASRYGDFVAFVEHRFGTADGLCRLKTDSVREEAYPKACQSTSIQLPPLNPTNPTPWFGFSGPLEQAPN